MEGDNGALEEESQERAISLLREWWLAAMQALIDEVGSEEALRCWKPYFVNAGSAAAQRICEFTGHRPETPGEAMAFWNGINQNGFTGGTHAVWTDGKDAAVGETSQCALASHGKEICTCLCKYGGAGIDDVLPDFIYDQYEMADSFNDYCRFKLIRKGRSSLPECPIRVALPKLPPETANYLFLSYFGEFWVIATKAFIDNAGAQKATEKLGFYIRHSGLSEGIRLSKQLDIDTNDAGILANIISNFNRLHHKSEVVDLGKEISQGTVTECPFSDAPPEICKQYEAFFNGICEAINPDFEFKYYRMMTKGDTSCHWTIRKKDIPQNATFLDVSHYETSLELLKKRYVRGEISKEEYLDMKRTLEE